MKIETLWAFLLFTTAFCVVGARDIPHGPDLQVEDFMISEDENGMDYSNYTADQRKTIMECFDHIVTCDAHGQYKHHPEGCSKFVQCSWSTPIEHTCSPGTVWLQSVQNCVHLPNSHCGQIAPVSPSSTVKCSCGIAKTTNRIVGGVEVSPEGKYPWQVAIFRNFRITLEGPKDFNCGGSVINNKYILTAAHCVHDSNPSDNGVVIKEHNNRNVQHKDVLKVKEIIIHPCYDCRSGDYDVALLELEDTIIYDKDVMPICLPEDDSKSYAGRDAIVAGWGQTSFNPPTSDKLMELNVTILDNNNCGNYPRHEITPNMLCAKDPMTDDNNICTGDSGGPLIVDELNNGRYVQVGVVSFAGPDKRDENCNIIGGCNVKGYPGGYARVSKVLDWIKATSASGQYCHE